MRRFIFFVKDVIASGAVGIALLSGGAEAADELPPLPPPGDGARLVAQQPDKPDQPPKPDQ
ncbi:MAG TPA: hypothetical protein VFW33_06765, partial [Gemmataceae bacterium]|nr:hypothetical protein [Gemmataceae bacterium]